MLYNQLFTFIRPFFVSRGLNSLSNNDMLEQYVNISIEDMWSYHDWIFKIANETITTYTEQGDYRYWTTQYSIDRPIEIYDEYNNSLVATSGRIENNSYEPNPTTTDNIVDPYIINERDCIIGNNFIKTKKDIQSIYIRYYKQYDWIEFSKDGTKPLPFPNKFIPPLLNKIYDLASPLSYFEDDNIVPRYQIAVRQLDQLKAADGLTADVYFMPDKSL